MRTSATGPTGLSHRRIQLVYLGLMLGLMVAALDQTIVATALPTIAGDLGGINELSWVVAAYLLASTATTPLFGKLGDLYGRKVVFQLAIVVFLCGSALSGLAHSMGQLVAFRAVQGLGAGGILPQVMSIVGDIVAPRTRARYQGYLNAVFTLAAVSGPAVGGLLTQDVSWRWCFYINLPIGAVALVVTSLVLKLPFTRVPHKVDYAGAALLSAAVTAFLLLTVWGGTTYRWGSPVILVTGAAVVLLVCFFLIQESRASDPLLPLGLWRNQTFRVVIGSGFLAMVAFTGTVTYLPLFLQLVTGVAPTLSGLVLVPQSLGLMLCSILVGRRVVKTGRYRSFPILGAVVTAGGIALLSTLGAQSGPPLVAALMLLVGIGLGGILTVVIVALQNDVPQREMGTATAAYMFFRNIGSSVGAAVYGAVMNDRLRQLLPRLLPGRLGRHLSLSALSYSPAAVDRLAAPLRRGLVDAFGRALHTVFLFGIPVAVLTVLLLSRLKERPLRQAAYVEANALAGAQDRRVSPVPVVAEDLSAATADGRVRPPSGQEVTGTASSIVSWSRRSSSTGM